MSEIKPYFETKLGKLYCGDCLEIMRKISIDNNYVVITDPPFNAGKNFENDNLVSIDFKAFCDSLTLLLHRLSPCNILVEVGKNDSFMRDCLNRYFDYRYSICLNYTNSMRNGSVGYSNFGLVLWFSRNGKCFSRYKDRIDSNLNNTKQEFNHPSPKEITHYRYLVEMFSTKKHIVVDPFLGSGTTAIACEQTGRKWIGIELDEKYCEIAKQRIIKESRQIALFGAEEGREV